MRVINFLAMFLCLIISEKIFASKGPTASPIYKFLTGKSTTGGAGSVELPSTERSVEPTTGLKPASPATLSYEETRSKQRQFDQLQKKYRSQLQAAEVKDIQEMIYKKNIEISDTQTQIDELVGKTDRTSVRERTRLEKQLKGLQSEFADFQKLNELSPILNRSPFMESTKLGRIEELPGQSVLRFPDIERKWATVSTVRAELEKSQSESAAQDLENVLDEFARLVDAQIEQNYNDVKLYQKQLQYDIKRRYGRDYNLRNLETLEDIVSAFNQIDSQKPGANLLKNNLRLLENITRSLEKFERGGIPFPEPKKEAPPVPPFEFEVPTKTIFEEGVIAPERPESLPLTAQQMAAFRTYEAMYQKSLQTYKADLLAFKEQRGVTSTTDYGLLTQYADDLRAKAKNKGITGLDRAKFAQQAEEIEKLKKADALLNAAGFKEVRIK